MKTRLDCIFCIQRQALDAVRLVTNDVKEQERILIQIKKSIGDFIPQSLESFSLSLSIHFPGILPRLSVQQSLVLL